MLILEEVWLLRGVLGTTIFGALDRVGLASVLSDLFGALEVGTELHR